MPSPKAKTYIVIESQWVKEIVIFKHTIVAEEGLSEDELVDRMHHQGQKGFTSHECDRIGTDGDPDYEESEMSLAKADTEEAIREAQDIATEKLNSIM